MPSMLAIASHLRIDFRDAADRVTNNPSASNFLAMIRAALAHQASVTAHGPDYAETRERIETMTADYPDQLHQWAGIVYECVHNNSLSAAASRMANAA